MKVIITAGGSGGHIYPAIALLEKIEKEEDLEVIYIGTHNRMEKDIIPKLDYKYIPLEVYGLSKDIRRNFHNIKCLINAYKESLSIINDFKPDIVIGFGGYVTYPVIKAASKLKVKTFIHEQNIIPGKTNKLLSKYASLIGVTFKESFNKLEKRNVVLTGHPNGQKAIESKKISKTKYGLSKDKKAVLIVAGSLGSTSFNDNLMGYLNMINNEDYEVIFITGKEHYYNIKKQVTSANVFPVPYVENLSSLMKDVDLIISRAGAGILSEIASLSLPSILIPSPFVANNHQYYNALIFKNHKAGKLIEEKDIDKYSLNKTVNKILYDRETSKKYRENLSKIKIDNSLDIIYNEIKKIVV